MNRSFYRRFGWPIVIIYLALLPLTIWAARKTFQSTRNEARDWLPEHYPETIEYDRFTSHFGGEEFVLVTWEGCTLDDPRLARFRKAVEDQRQAAPPGQALFERIITGPSLLKDLTEDSPRLEPKQAIDRLRGSLIGRDGQQTCAVVRLSEVGLDRLRRSMRTLTGAATDSGAPLESLRMGGLPVVNDAINQAGIETLQREALLASLIGVVIAWRLFRTIRLTLAVAVTALYSAAAALAVVWLSGVAMNSILITMAPLVFVAATSGAIHLANYYLDAVQEGGLEGAAERAALHAWTPLGLATATTAVGLLSLLYSDLSPIRHFGVFSAAGIVLGWILTLTFLPAFIVVWPFGKIADQASEGESGREAGATLWRRFSDLVMKRPRLFSLAGIALLIAGGVTMMWMKTSVDIMRLFHKNAPILADYAWLEENLGYLMPVEAVVRFPAGDESRNTLEKLELVHEVEQALRRAPEVGSSLSAAAFLPDLEGGSGTARLSAARSVANRRLGRQFDRFHEYGFFSQSDDEELWRITLRVGPFHKLDYDQLLNDLRAHVAAVTKTAEGAPGFDVSFTGVMPVVHKARVSLLRDLLFGLATDLVLIFAAMIVLMRHWSSGLLLLLVAVLPTTIVFGSLVGLGVIVEIGSLMAPCVALGVTVDDAIHFLLWYRRGIQQGLDQRQAVRLAYDGCARAMVQSWVILGLGLSVLLLSSFSPNVQFGSAMVVLLTAGMFGNLIFLPALLTGPLGGVIARSVRKRFHEPPPSNLEPI